MSTATIQPSPKYLPNYSYSDTDAAVRKSILDPVLFAQNWLGATLWSKQLEILRSVATRRKTAVKACHSSSKTYTAALATLWWLARYEESVVVTTAPTQNQVEKLLWSEIRAMVASSKFPYSQPTLTGLSLGPKRFATGFTTSVEKGDAGVKMQGFHSKHILLILDEAPGVEGALWEAIEGLLASGDTRVLALGNPVIGSGPFYDAFGINKPFWNTLTISAFDTPNLEGVSLEKLLQMSEDELNYNPTPYLTSRHWVKERYQEWGPTHPLFLSRVMGEFPKQAPDALLSLTWLEQARNRTCKKGTKKLNAGVDVAGPGEDETVLVVRDGSQIILQKSWPQADPRGELLRELLPYKDKIEVNVDSCGIGYYLARHLEDNGFVVSDVNVGHAASDKEKYANLKAELYWNLRMRLEEGDFGGLTDDLAISQLAGIRFKTNARGQITIESKDEARKRGVKSPDRAEAIMLCFAPSFQHGLFGYWEDLAQQGSKEMERVKLSSAEAASTVSDAQKRDAGFPEKFEDLHSVVQVSTLGKVVTCEQTPACPICSNKFLATYGEDVKRCNQCGWQSNRRGN